MKKSIVLLISLLFISILSLLIIKNLDDTNTYVEEQNIKLNKIQIVSLFTNAKLAAFDVIKKYKNELDDEKLVPFSINNIDIVFSLVEYNRKDINLFNDKKNRDRLLEDIFISKDINDFELFKVVFDGIKEKFFKKTMVNNNKQLDAIINAYLNNSYSKNKNEIKSEFGFFPLSKEEKIYELTLSINYLNNKSKAYYILDEKKVRYFEISFK